MLDRFPPMSVRVRYAPSPTGSPHVGNIRTALYDHLFARHHHGTFIFRLEDTDRTRFQAGSEEEQLESLKYVGVQIDEGVGIGGPCGPYRQSERKAAGLYQPFIDKLVNEGSAYWAFDTTEELDEMRLFQQVNKQPTGYFGGQWRDASEAKAAEAREAGKPGVLRLRIPKNERIVLEDAIRGRLEFDSNTLDDIVLIKADGMPTYHFAAMVDDHLMDISHVFRGEEWISSAPKHVVLWRALGVTPPVLVHLPVIKGKDGSKLSKRHGDTACLDFRRSGYLGDALANFIALIGWAPGDDREIMSEEDMIAAFSLKGIQPSSGIFDLDKLNWMNSARLRALTVDELAMRFSDYVNRSETESYWQKRAEADPEASNPWREVKMLAQVQQEDPEYALKVIALEQERVTSLADFGPKSAFFLVDLPELDQKALAKWKGQSHIPGLFSAVCQAVASADPAAINEVWCESLVRAEAEKLGLDKIGPVVHPLRLALTGQTVGPGLWELMAVLGKDRILNRLTANGVHFA